MYFDFLALLVVLLLDVCDCGTRWTFLLPLFCTVKNFHRFCGVAWGRESLFVCFACVCLFCTCWFVSLSSFSWCQGLAATCGPVLVLLLVALWFVLRGDLLCVFPCVVLFLCFSVLLVLRLPRLGRAGEGGADAGLGAFRTFVRFVLVWVCRFPFPLGVWEGLRFVIVAHPGLFSYFLAHLS